MYVFYSNEHVNIPFFICFLIHEIVFYLSFRRSGKCKFTHIVCHPDVSPLLNFCMQDALHPNRVNSVIPFYARRETLPKYSHSKTHKDVNDRLVYLNWWLIAMTLVTYVVFWVFYDGFVDIIKKRELTMMMHNQICIYYSDNQLLIILIS